MGTLRAAAATLFALAMLAAPAMGAAPRQGEAPPAPPDIRNPPADAAKTASGLVSKVLTPGRTSEHPAPTDVVTVSYTAWEEDGTVVDTTAARPMPPMFPLDKTGLPGFRECVQLMTPGEKRRCWLPEKLAYAGAPNRPDGTIVFDVELIESRRSPIVAPPDVVAPPADALTSPKGIFYKVLRPGTGTRMPGPDDQVLVHYTGWTTAGRVFDSSLLRGEPTTLGVSGGVIEGWTEALMLMVEGQVMRVWIPQKLAYKGQQGAPAGNLVFEFELFRIL